MGRAQKGCGGRQRPWAGHPSRWWRTPAATADPAAATPVPQVLRKLEASLTAGQFYEAHEMFKTVYYRHRSRSQSEESYQLCQVGQRLQQRD